MFIPPLRTPLELTRHLVPDYSRETTLGARPLIRNDFC
jgi:hypothetical protein